MAVQRGSFLAGLLQEGKRLSQTVGISEIISCQEVAGLCSGAGDRRFHPLEGVDSVAEQPLRRGRGRNRHLILHRFFFADQRVQRMLCIAFGVIGEIRHLAVYGPEIIRGLLWTLGNGKLYE